MSVTIHEVLGDLRAPALDERDKGDKFERLIQTYLRNDPEWTASSPTSGCGRSGQAATAAPTPASTWSPRTATDDGFTAIQCKFYAADAHGRQGRHRLVPRPPRARPSSRQRYIFDTAKGWSRNADETLEGQRSRCSASTSATSTTPAIDWSQYSWTTPEVLVHDRPEDSCALTRRGPWTTYAPASPTHDRGKLIMACGTGKTFTSLKIAEDLVGAGGTRAVPGAVHPAAVPVAAGVDGQRARSTSGRSRSAPTSGSAARPPTTPTCRPST